MRRACSTVEIHFDVALDQAVEEKSGEALGLRVGAEAGVEVGGIGFDDEGQSGGIGWGVGAGGEEGGEKKKPAAISRQPKAKSLFPRGTIGIDRAAIPPLRPANGAGLRSG
jgi:hypothetical protein